MKSAKWLAHLTLLIVLAFFMSLALPTGAAEDTVVLFPPDLTLVKEGKVKIFAFRNGGTPIPVAVNGIARDPLKGESLQSGQADLRPGMNFVDVGEKRLGVYFEANAETDHIRILPGKDEAPLVFQAYRIHPALDDGCEGCHAVEGGKLKAKGQKEACYGCHENFEKEEKGRKKYLHAPVKAGECTGCHDPHYAKGQRLMKPGKGCLECHDPFPSEGTVHSPAAKGECMSCHAPHVSQAPGLLASRGNSTCIKCHDKSHEQHRSATVRSGGNTTSVPPDVPLDNADLSCLACHLPHQSGERRLFRKSQGELCKICHQM